MARDEGTVQAFSVTHDGSVYSATDLPAQILDLQTSYAHVGSSAPLVTAYLEIRHSWRGDLVVKVGAGDPANPGWVTTVSDREGEDADDLVKNVDLSAAAAYLPPDSLHPWFLEVSDNADGDEGSIEAFTISYHGSASASDYPPVEILDNRTSYAYVGGRTAGGEAPRQLVLRQNRPNPFKPSTSILFDLPAATHVTLRIYDVNGRAVRSLVDGQLTPDVYTLAWDGNDDDGERLASGVYFYRLDAGGRTLTSKMVMLR